MIIFSYYFLQKSSKMEEFDSGINFLKILILNCNYAFIGLSILGFFSPHNFSRFTHYCIIPIYFSLVGLKRFEKNNLAIYFLPVLMGLLTYSYSSIITNLIWYLNKIFIPKITIYHQLINLTKFKIISTFNFYFSNLIIPVQ